MGFGDNLGKRWKIICPATDWTQVGRRFQHSTFHPTLLREVNRYLLQVGFAFYPPPCPTYLLTDEHPSIEASFQASGLHQNPEQI